MTDFDAELFLRILHTECSEEYELVADMSRAKHWCFTLNNYTFEDVDRITNNATAFDYIVFGKEIGDSGTPHLQGFVSFPNRVRRKLCIEKIGQAHFTIARHIDNSIKYCKKDGEFYEFGTPKAGAAASQRNLMQVRLKDMKQRIKDKHNRDDLFESDPVTYVIYSKWIEQEIARAKPEAVRDVQVHLLHGEPGTNKTRFAFHMFPDLYAIPCNTANASVWFNGYEGESTVLLDDFSGEMPLVQLLRLLDIYRVQVPYKGGYVWFAPQNILITTNVHPRKWYDYEKRDSSWQALKRRITSVLDFNRRRWSDECNFEVGRELNQEEDKEEFTWDDIDNSLKKYTEDLPLKVAQSLIESLPEEGRALMNYLLTKQANLTKDDLTQYYEEHLKTTLTSIDNEDVARDYLREHYKGKFRASQITAMLDALEDEEGLVEEADKIKEELKREKERTLDQERQSQVTSQKQFVQSLSSEFQQLPWDTNRIEKVKQSIVSGEGNAKLAKIAQSPNGLIHLYNFMTYFDETNGKFDLTDFAKIATTKQVKGLKDSLTEDMLSSASNSTKASNRKIGGIDISKLQPIID